jgi:hypothetical protein
MPKNITLNTPLLPENDGPVSIQQGEGGNCSLLTTFGCLVTLGPPGYNAVKKLFTETKQGVEVRIKHNRMSKNIDTARAAANYNYRYDEKTHEDVFFISLEKLKEIDNTTNISVTTNSLALKILLRLNTYYLFKTSTRKLSVDRIQIPDDEDKYAMPDSFIHYLLGPLLKMINMEHAYIDQQAFESTFLKVFNKAISINDVITLKTCILASLPILIGIDYAKKDKFGQFHSRHALRIKEIRKNKHGEFEFILVNPWNNQKTETLTEKEIRKRNPIFHIIDPHEDKIELIMELLKRYKKTNPPMSVANSKFLDALLLINKNSFLEDYIFEPTSLEGYISNYALLNQCLSSLKIDITCLSATFLAQLLKLQEINNNTINDQLVKYAEKLFNQTTNAQFENIPGGKQRELQNITRYIKLVGENRIDPTEELALKNSRPTKSFANTIKNQVAFFEQLTREEKHRKSDMPSRSPR